MVTIQELEPRASTKKKILTLSRYMSGYYSSIPDLLNEEDIPELWLYQWRQEYNARFYQYFSKEENRDYNKSLEDLNILAIIPARGGSKGLKKKAIRRLNGKPLIAYSIEACLASKYVNKILVTTDDPEIAEISRSYGAYVPFLRPAVLATDNIDLFHTIVHATTYMELVEDYWYDFMVQLSPTYPLREESDIDQAFEQFYASKFRSLQSIDKIDTNTGPYYFLENSRLRYFQVKRRDNGRLYGQSGFLRIMSRRPNYHLPISEYKRLVSIPKDRQVYMVDASKAIDIDNEEDLLLCELLLNKRQYQQNVVGNLESILSTLPKVSISNHSNKHNDVLCIIRADSSNIEYQIDGMPLVCMPILAVKASVCFNHIAIAGDFNTMENLSAWADIRCFKKGKFFRLDGFPRKQNLRLVEREFQKKFDHICVIDCRAPLIQPADIRNFLRLYYKNNCVPTKSVSTPRVHPYGCKCIEDGKSVGAYINPSIGQRQKLPDVYVQNGALCIAPRGELSKRCHVRSECGYFLNRGRTVRIESLTDFLRLMWLYKAEKKNNG
jgi:CMP-N,N'-diacetyllegionaminic acid synthase